MRSLAIALCWVPIVACSSKGPAPEQPTPDAAMPVDSDSDEPADASTKATCGNSIVEDGEVCDDGVNDHKDGGCLPGCEKLDNSDDVFAKAMVDVRIDLAPADFEVLRFEDRPRHEVFGGPDCGNRAPSADYSWFPAKITIDGIVFDGAGVRKKGFLGSQAQRNPAMKIDFSKFTATKQRYRELESLSLNNNKQDRSMIRQCLTYSLYRSAGLPAPRCTLSHVFVNGVDQGVYTLLEDVDNDFLKRRYADANGNMYEGTVVDFRDEWIGGFDRETNKTDPSRADLIAIKDAIEADDSEVVARLAAVINLEQFYKFWALESLVWHRDGYGGNSNNYFFYANPLNGNKFEFIPWGADGAMRTNTNAALPDSVLAFGRLANRLYAIPAERARYHQVLTDLLALWQESELNAEIDRVSALVEPLLTSSDAADQRSEASALRTFVNQRKSRIMTAMASNPDWTAGLRRSFCRIKQFDFSGTFSTTWGTATLGSTAVGNFTLTIDGDPVVFTTKGARAGFPTSGAARVILVGNTGTRRYTLTATFPDERWFEPFDRLGTFPMASPPMIISLTEVDTSRTPNVTLRNMETGGGSWTFSSVGRVNDNPIAGSFTSSTWLLPP